MSVQYIIDGQGKRVGVFLPVEEYERLLEELEELEDIKDYDKAKAELERGEDELIPWEEAEKRIGSEYEDPLR